jgi:hypothetical protein
MIHQLRVSTEWSELQVPCQDDLSHQQFLVKSMLVEASAQDITFFFGQPFYSSLIKTMTIEGYPLLYAVLHYRQHDEDINEIFDALIQCGGDINQPRSFCCTFHSNSQHSHCPTAGYTPIFYCVRNFFDQPFTDICQNSLKLLLAKGADINAMTFNNNTVLSEAIYLNQKPELIIFLLEHGANPNQFIAVSDTYMSSALFYLIETIGRGGERKNEAMALARVLLKYGANPHVGEGIPKEGVREGRSAYQEVRAQYDRYQYEGFAELLELFAEHDRAITLPLVFKRGG